LPCRSSTSSAIAWCKEQRQYLQQLGIERDYQAEHSLHHYWEIYWETFLKIPNLKARAKKEQQEYDEHHNLHAYWEGNFAKESRKRETTRGFARWKRDECLKWEGEGYGASTNPGPTHLWIGSTPSTLRSIGR